MHRGFGHCASLWPYSWQRSHTSSIARSCCICASSVHELRIPIVLDGHSRAEWPVAPHVLHTRYGHEPIFSGDAQIARTAYSSSCTLSFLYDAIQIHSWRKPSRVRSMLIRFSSLLIRFLYAAALLGPPLPGPYLLTQRPCLDLRCQALTYEHSCEARRGKISVKTKI